MKKTTIGLILAGLLSVNVLADNDSATDITLKTGNNLGGLKVEHIDDSDYYYKGEYEQYNDEDVKAELGFGFGEVEGITEDAQIYGYVNYQKDTIDWAQIDNVAIGGAYDLSLPIDEDITVAHGGRLGVVAGDTCGVDAGLYGRIEKKLSKAFKTYGQADFGYKGGDGGCAEFIKASIEAGIIFEMGDRFYVKLSATLEGSDLDDVQVYEDRHEIFGYHYGSDYYLIDTDVSNDAKMKYNATFGVRF